MEPYVDGLVAAQVEGAIPKPELYSGAAALKLTSGSTGLPKATFTTERELILDTEHIVTAMGITSGHTQLAVIPLSHAYGLGSLLIPALVQGTAVVLRESFVPHAIVSDARDYGAAVLPGVPFMFEHLLTSLPAGAWPDGLCTLISAGARLGGGTVRRFHEAFGVKIHSFYGTSETGGIAYDDSDDVRAETTVGKPMPGVQVTLREEEGAPPDGGRVHVAGEAVAARYAGERPSDGAFADGGFLTGDFGRFDERGHLVLTGRASAFHQRRRAQGAAGRGGAGLRGMPGVADVRVLGAPDAARGQQIVACVVATGGPVTLLALRRFCAAPAGVAQGTSAGCLARPYPADRSRQDRSRGTRAPRPRPPPGRPKPVCYSSDLSCRRMSLDGRRGRWEVGTRMNVWKPVELALADGARAGVASVSGGQPPVRRASLPAEVGAGAALKSGASGPAAARLAAHDRFALSDLRARGARPDPVRRAVGRVARQRARRRDPGADPRARRPGHHREDVPEARHLHRHAGDQPGVPQAPRDRCSRAATSTPSPTTLHNHGTSSIKYGRGAVLTIDLTNRCNMMCDPCFMDANQVGYVHELTLDEVKQLLDDAISIKPRRQMTVQFSGGEPTISPIFLDAVRYARRSATSASRRRPTASASPRIRSSRSRRARPACGSPTCSSTASAKRPTRTARSATCST